MATANDILRIAAGEIGYYRHNDPLNGTKYGRWYAEKTNSSYFAQNNVPFCAMGVSWVFDQAGQSMPGLPTASCAVIRNANRGTSRDISKKNAKPGDIILFDWDGDGAPDHVGIVELNKGSYVQTIEFNTSNSAAGSQGNGGWVARKTRAWSTVYAVYRPVYGTTKKNMSAAGIADVPAQTYTGKAITPKLTSSAGATFSTSYKDNTAVGYGTATATGTGDWTGSVSKQFKILPKSLVAFSDVGPTAWYVDSLSQAVESGWLKGYDTGKIGPSDTMTRGQACVILARYCGFDLESPFSDVVASPYYYEAVQACEDAGIVNGNGGKFNPDDPCTREQFACMLHNLAKNPEPKGEPSGYTDWASVSEWAKDSFAWCVEQGIISGNAGKLRPSDKCTRAEACAMLCNYDKKVK